MAVKPKIRHRNTALRFKLETSEGVDAAPGAADAFPFEVDSVDYNGPYRAENSNEANSSLEASAPLIVGEPATVTLRVRVKGAGAGTTYSASVKPPHHALLEACGWRGVFTAAIASQDLDTPDANAPTLGASFPNTAQALRGLPLQLSGSNYSGSASRLVHVTDYSAGRVAQLVDTLDPVPNNGVDTTLPANWSYAPTSPQDQAARTTDQPSGTLYIYEDGVLRKFFGLRGMVDMQGETARPGFATFQFRGIFGGKSDVARPADTVPQHGAPVLAMGTGGTTPTVVVNSEELPISNWALRTSQAVEANTDPNTALGFGAGELGGRDTMVTLDPNETLVATRDVVGDIEAGNEYTGVIRCGTVEGNRWSLTLPKAIPTGPQPGRRGIFRTEEMTLKALNRGIDPSSRDSSAVLCFY